MLIANLLYKYFEILRTLPRCRLGLDGTVGDVAVGTVGDVAVGDVAVDDVAVGADDSKIKIFY